MIFSRGSRHQQRVLLTTALTFIIAGIFAFLFAFFQPFASINWRLSDQMFVPGEFSNNIVIVAIDDESLATYGRWADWPRSLHAQAIENLSQAKAQVVGMDILFADVSSEDEILVQAIEEAGNVALAVVGGSIASITSSMQVYDNILTPTPELGSVAVAVGHANMAPDGDGVVRRLPLFTRDVSGNTYASLSLVMVSNLFAQPLPSPDSLAGGKLTVIGRDILLGTQGDMRINFSGRPGDYPRISYKSVIEGTFDAALVEHKLVLIGMTATGESDFWVTPVAAEKMSGVEIHANAIDTILRQRFLQDEGWVHNFLVSLLLAAIAAVALTRIRFRWGVLVMVLLLAGYLGWAFYAFDSGYRPNILYPIAILPLAYLTNLTWRAIDERRNRQRLEGIFGRYVSPQVAREIMRLDDEKTLSLGGERREATVLFLDARGYTTLSSGLEPEGVITLINQYFSVIIPCILETQGMINKFAGDSIMAVWGAPANRPEHALLAVKAAVAAQRAIGELQEKQPDILKVEFGMGINTGPVVAGNVGSMGRTEYTVIGDTVNVSSRLCGSAPGGKIWLSEDTYRRVADAMEVEELGPHSFKGKEAGMMVYQVIALK